MGGGETWYQRENNNFMSRLEQITAGGRREGGRRTDSW